MSTYSDDAQEGARPAISPLLNVHQFPLTEVRPKTAAPLPMRRTNVPRVAAGRHGVLGSNPNDRPHPPPLFTETQKLAAHLGLPTEALDGSPLSPEEQARARRRPVKSTGIRFGMN